MNLANCYRLVRTHRKNFIIIGNLNEYLNSMIKKDNITHIDSSCEVKYYDKSKKYDFVVLDKRYLNYDLDEIFLTLNIANVICLNTVESNTLDKIASFYGKSVTKMNVGQIIGFFNN